MYYFLKGECHKLFNTWKPTFEGMSPLYKLNYAKESQINMWTTVHTFVNEFKRLFELYSALHKIENYFIVRLVIQEQNLPALVWTLCIQIMVSPLPEI